jgi:hypothetical protein
MRAEAQASSPGQRRFLTGIMRDPRFLVNLSSEVRRHG